MPSGSEEQIRNALLQSAYNQREDKYWLTDKQILRETELDLKVKQIKYHLSILCDRGLLQEKSEKTPTINFPKGAKKLPIQCPAHSYSVFRITSAGEDFVREGFKRHEIPTPGHGMVITNSPGASVMVNSPHGQLTSYGVHPEFKAFIEELRTLINEMPDNSEKKGTKQLVEALAEECNKPSPERSVIETILGRLAMISQISTAVVQFLNKLGI